jgi:hypothetical protein
MFDDRVRGTPGGPGGSDPAAGDWGAPPPEIETWLTARDVARVRAEADADADADSVRRTRPVIPEVTDGPVDGAAIALLAALPIEATPVSQRIDAVNAWTRAVDYAQAMLLTALAAAGFDPEPDGVPAHPGRSGGGTDWTLAEVKVALANSQSGARAQLDEAQMLAGPFLAIRELLRAGRIPYLAVKTLVQATAHLRDQPEVLARIQADLIARVQKAIERGEVLTLTRLRRLIHTLVARHEDPAQAAATARRAARTERRADVYPTEHGMGALHANLTAPEAAFCDHALTRLARTAKYRGDHSSLANRRATALFNALAHAANGTPLFPDPVAPHDCHFDPAADGEAADNGAPGDAGAASKAGATDDGQRETPRGDADPLTDAFTDPQTGWTWENLPPGLGEILYRPPGRPIPNTPPEAPPWDPAQEPAPDGGDLGPDDPPDVPDPYPDGKPAGDWSEFEDTDPGCPGCTDEHRPRVPVTVQLIIDLPTLLGLKDDPAHLLHHGPLPAALAREFADGGALRRLVTDPVTGALLDYGHDTYVPPKALRDFIKARDRHCTFQGCHQRAETCDLDHVEPHPQGATAAWNIDPKCRHDHRLKTFSGWTVERSADGTTTWTTPGGRRYLIPPFNHHEDY